MGCCYFKFAVDALWTDVKLGISAWVDWWIIDICHFRFGWLRMDIHHIDFIKIRTELYSLLLFASTLAFFCDLLIVHTFLLPHIFLDINFLFIVDGLAHSTRAFWFAFLHDTDFILYLQIMVNWAEIAIWEKSVWAIKSDWTIHDHFKGLFFFHTLLQMILDDLALSNIA